MGAQQSKVQVAVPAKAQCFPWFEDETELLTVVKKVHECHSQAIQAATWIAGNLLPVYCVPGGLVFTAATILFTFLLYQLTGTSQSDAPSSKTLEDALIDAKVSSAISRKSVCELQAKICVVQNRYERLLSKSVSAEDRRLEVVPAIQTCEEILQLFHDASHVFRLHPLVASPFLITFSGIFVSVAELSLVLIPSYKDPLVREMKLLNETLQIYKQACIQARMDGIKFKNLKPDTMMDAVAGNHQLRFEMLDGSVLISENGKLLNIKECKANNSNEGQSDECSGSVTSKEESCQPHSEEPQQEKTVTYDSANEAIEEYKKMLVERYSMFFDSASETVSQFSAFENGSKGSMKTSDCKQGGVKCVFPNQKNNNGNSSDDEFFVACNF